MVSHNGTVYRLSLIKSKNNNQYMGLGWDWTDQKVGKGWIDWSKFILLSRESDDVALIFDKSSPLRSWPYLKSSPA